MDTTTEDFCLRCRAPAAPGALLCAECESREPELQRRKARELEARRAVPGRVATALEPVAPPPPARMAKCRGCGTEIYATETACEACIAKRRLESERRHTLTRVPFAWVDDPEKFSKAVRSRDLRKLADGYQLEDGGVVLSGPTGWGKTATLARVVRRLVSEAGSGSPLLSRTGVLGDSHGVLWVDAHDVALARRRHKLGEGEPPLLEQAASAHLLVVDEAGFEPAETALFEVVNRRYLAGRPTLLTSGATIEQLGEKYGSGFVRRVISPAGVLLKGWS